MLSIRGTYDGKQLKLSEKIKIRSPKKVIITFLDEIEKELSKEELNTIAQHGGGLEFLHDEEELYSDKNLKVVYK